MDFANAPGFKIFYYVVLLIVFIAIMKGLVMSAINSLKRSGGKVSSIFDEIIVGIIFMVGFFTFAMLPPATVFSWLTNVLMWFWDWLLQLLRFVNLPV